MIYLKVSNGIAIVLNHPININNNKNIVDIFVDDAGLRISYQGATIILPEDMLDYFVENNNITIYPGKNNPDFSYLLSPIVTLEIQKESLIEARAIFKYKKSINS